MLHEFHTFHFSLLQLGHTVAFRNEYRYIMPIVNNTFLIKKTI